LAEQVAGELRNLPSHWVEFEAVQKRVCFCFLSRAHSHVNLGDIHRATGEKNILMGKLCEKLGAAVPIVQGIN
jgi:hypothetical protein